MSLFAISWTSTLTSGWVLAKLSSSSLAVGRSDAELFIPKDRVVAPAVDGAGVVAAVLVAAGAWLAGVAAAGVDVELAQPASRASASALGTSRRFSIPIPLR